MGTQEGPQEIKYRFLNEDERALVFLVESEVEQEVLELSLVLELDHVLESQLVISMVDPALHLKDDELDEEVESFLMLNWNLPSSLNDVANQFVQRASYLTFVGAWSDS